MDNFNLKKYLAEGRLFEEEGQFDSDIQNNTNKNDFFFWYRGGKRGEKQALQAKELLQQNGIDADYSLGPYYINLSKAGVEQRVAHQILRDAGLTNFIIGNTNDITINENNNKMDNFNLKKYLAESHLLEEGAPLKTTTEDVDVSVTIKNNKLIDDYKVQQYVNELGELIQNHINKGN